MKSTPPVSSSSPPWLSAIPGWVHVSALGGLIVVILVLVYVTSAFRGQNVWAGWEESRGLRRSNYMEKIHVNEVFRTCSNTWSNLAYVLVGFYAFGLARWDRRRTPLAGNGYLARTPP